MNLIIKQSEQIMDTTLKHSEKRDAILRCLRDTDIHPTAGWLYEQLRRQHAGISRATVYRNLAQLRAQGEIISVGSYGGFERFDGRTDPHSHFVCRRCGAVLDVDGVGPGQGLSRQAAGRLGAEIDGCWVLFSGVCAECSSK